MSTSIYWMRKQLLESLPINVTSENTGEFFFDGKKMILYCPTTSEYEITSQVIIKASDLKADIIAFPTQWCKATREAIEYGKTLGIKVIPFGHFINVYGKA